MAIVSPLNSNSDGLFHAFTDNASEDTVAKKSVKLRKCTLISWAIIILLVSIVFITTIALLLVWNAKCQAKITAIEKRDTYCDLGVCNNKFRVPPLIVISLDGFRSSYLSQNITPAIQRLISCGTHSKYLLPSFPSKTFPNHYTIATGLYPAWSGIVDNQFYDPNFNEFFKKNVTRSGWFLGEPIWSTVKRAGLKSGVYFWPGSEGIVLDNLPTYWKTYNFTVPFTQRIDSAIEWLKLPEGERPSLVQIYFEQPDVAGHSGGPESEEVRTAMILMDGMINYLTKKLIREGLMGCVNLILLSDHGMQKIVKSRSVVTGNNLSSKFNDMFFPGVVARIQVNENGNKDVDEMISNMACKRGTDYLIYKKDLVPIRFHYAGSARIGDVIFKGRPEVCVFLTDQQKNDYKLLGDHGYDNRIVSMRAIFVAIGPDIAEKREIDDFQNIELYNLFAYLLRIDAAPNNGTNGTLFSVLRNPPPIPETISSEPSLQCTKLSSLTKCNTSLDCSRITDVYRNCSQVMQSSVGFTEDFIGEHCNLPFCDALIHFNQESQQTVMVEGILRKSTWRLEPKKTCMTYFDEIPSIHSCETARSENFTSISLFANIGLRFPFGYYLSSYGDLLFFSGPIYDKDGDGVRDEIDIRESHDFISTAQPSHIFFVLMRCRNGQLIAANNLCKDIISLPYILPIHGENLNCLKPSEYLNDNTVRLRDIELLTGTQFFTDRNIWSAAEAIQLRTSLPEITY
ncbi:unnamed protein product [Thelazia callipaeda]|uniref:NUC domain-containing protein n=1 Tax=Thelazia callipaeda TaxID=103827 RepID=A0A158RAM5_THECL|nr:unnamed protein product [Thelazia callipaeda]